MSSGNGLEGLDKLQKNVERLAGEHRVQLANLLAAEFMSECSSFHSFEELITASGFKVESAEDFAAIPDDEWDTFIRKATSYQSWQEMQRAAAVAYTRKQVFKGL